jgi:putative peptidoglycan lipid II flippase
LIAGLLQWLFLWPELFKTGVWSPFPKAGKHPGVAKIFALMLPGLFGVSVSQINLLLDTVLASLLKDGSVSWLYYSDRLTELPLGVIGIAIATVLLPRLSALHVEAEHQKFERTLAWAIRIVLLIGLPAMVALIILPDVLLTLLFQNYQFTAADVTQSGASLAAYAVGLPAFMLIKIMAPAFFSRQDTKTPVKIGIQAMVWNMVFNLILIYPLAHVGLALATSLSAWFNAGLLAMSLKKEGCFPPSALWLQSLVKGGIACGVMAFVLDWLMHFDWLQMPDDLLGRVRVASVLVVCGGLSYLLTLILARLKLSELRHP